MNFRIADTRHGQPRQPHGVEQKQVKTHCLRFATERCQSEHEFSQASQSQYQEVLAGEGCQRQ